MLQLPEVLKATEQMVREREAGQESLFGGFAEPASPARIELPEAAEWPLAQKLAGERDTLGHYLRGHPLDPSRDEPAALVGSDLGPLDALWPAGPNNGAHTAGRRWRPEPTVIIPAPVGDIRNRGGPRAAV